MTKMPDKQRWEGRHRSQHRISRLAGATESWKLERVTQSASLATHTAPHWNVLHMKKAEDGGRKESVNFPSLFPTVSEASPSWKARPEHLFPLTHGNGGRGGIDSCMKCVSQIDICSSRESLIKWLLANVWPGISVIMFCFQNSIWAQFRVRKPFIC